MAVMAAALRRQSRTEKAAATDRDPAAVSRPQNRASEAKTPQRSFLLYNIRKEFKVMRTVKRLITAIIVLMLVNDILQIYLEYRDRKKRLEKKAINRLGLKRQNRSRT